MSDETRTVQEIRESGDRTVGDYLAVDADSGTFSCAKCGHGFGPVEDNYKEQLVVRERDIEELGDLWIDPSILLDEEIVFREFLCPGCATRISTESCRQGDPIIPDVRLDTETL